jgi:hypothetical protein
MRTTRTDRLYPGRNNIPAIQQVKAIHIYVASGNVTAARRAYNLTFGGSNYTGYPLGQVLRFVPDISDPRYPASMQTRTKVIRMMSKQKHLLTSTASILTSTIVGLHVHYEGVGYTLCEILMGLRIGEDKAIPIFLSVTERLWDAGGNVVFSVKKIASMKPTPSFLFSASLSRPNLAQAVVNGSPKMLVLLQKASIGMSKRDC